VFGRFFFTIIYKSVEFGHVGKKTKTQKKKKRQEKALQEEGCMKI
jgi:hypothetical protein